MSDENPMYLSWSSGDEPNALRLLADRAVDEGPQKVTFADESWVLVVPDTDLLLAEAQGWEPSGPPRAKMRASDGREVWVFAGP